MEVTNKNGFVLDFDISVLHMDDEVREFAVNMFSPSSEQEFFSKYENVHRKLFGEVWELSKKNPTF